MYAEFAEVYDRLMGDFQYPKWAEYYLALLERVDCRPDALCDCACGTGSMSLEFAGRGIVVTGVDASEEMLRQAQHKARARGMMLPFVRQDMRELSLHRPVDAIVCACDGVNYLLDDEDLSRFFGAAWRNLKPGGVLAFDVSSAEKLRAQAQARFFGEDLPDLTYLWHNQYDEVRQTVQMDLCFFLRQKDGLYVRFDEQQTQRVHEMDSLIDALHRAGFEDVRCYGDRTFEPPQKGEVRL
ncbi:class I SAM-dependent methyltransferase, partial [Eubacteriales bacterium OttesenSCG-928-N13]|nr:class I SAM-dependent methyltransferase [Eubacteriales bacterium OttesenSCG-928-N13]